MAEFVREVEPGIGEYSDGAKRYLAGNQWGKQPGSLAERHPDAQVLTSDTAREIVQKRERYRLAAMDAVPPSRLADAARMFANDATDAEVPVRDRVQASGELRQILGLDSRRGDDAAPVVAIQVNVAPAQSDWQVVDVDPGELGG